MGRGWGVNEGCACLLLSDALGTLSCRVLVQRQPQTVHSPSLTGLQLQPNILELRDASLTARLLLLAWGNNQVNQKRSSYSLPTHHPPRSLPTPYPAPGFVAAAGSGDCRMHTLALPPAGPQAQSHQRPGCLEGRPDSAALGCAELAAAPRASVCGTAGGTCH